MKLQIDNKTKYEIEEKYEITAEEWPGMNVNGVTTEYYLRGPRGGLAMLRVYKNGKAELLKNMRTMSVRWERVSTFSEI